MLIDETCHFLCADFDDKEYEKDALAFCEICDELNIPAHIERSRSGYELVGPALTKRSLLAAGEIKPEGRISARKVNQKG